MKLTTALICIFLTTSISSFGQNCNCPDELLHVKNKIEINYAGFKDKVKPQTKAAYEKYTQAAYNQAKTITKPAYCLYLINNWLLYFKDRHIQVNRNRLSPEIEKQQLQQRRNNTEYLSLSAPQLAILKKKKTIEGVYWNPDSTCKIAVFSNKNSFRDYAGIVLESKLPYWKSNQVILEFKAKGKSDTLKGISYNNYLIPETVVIPVQQNSIADWQRENIVRTVKDEKEVLQEVTAQSLSDQTFYIKITSFNERNASAIDSVLKTSKTVLEKRPNLILDLRNNGGGSDFTYAPLMPYLYTDTIKEIGATVLSTADNTKGWAALLQLKGIPASEKTSIANLVKEMETHQGALIPLTKDRKQSYSEVLPTPKKIVILINGNCGSTTEEFLLAARQSTKVTLMGEHTRGVLDYSNIRGADFKALPYMLFWATSRSGRIDLGQAIDNIGIKPAVTLKPNQNWVTAAQQYLENK